MLTSYRIGLVVPRFGVSEPQLETIKHKLREIASFLEPEVKIDVLVPAYATSNPEAAIPPEILNLRYQSQVRILAMPFDSHLGTYSHKIYRELLADQCCDEVWCCPNIELLGASPQRCAALWRHAQQQLDAGGEQARMARRVKLIPARVSRPEAPEQPKAKKPKLRQGPPSYFDRQKRKGAR